MTSLDAAQAVTMYVDALDECDEDEIRAAIEHFEELRCAPIHICFASRHYRQITVQQCIELNLEDQHKHQNDIRKYIDNKLTIRNIGRKTRLATEIEGRSSGVFLWVVLMVRMIRKKTDNGAPYSELLQTLHEVPDGLQSLIGVILESPDAELLCALRWVLLAYRALTVPELYYAIHVSTCRIGFGAHDSAEVGYDDMKAFVLASSRGLTEAKTNLTPSTPDEEHVHPGPIVQLVHESVREYLLAGGLTALGLCSDDSVRASIDAELFSCCRTYLDLVSGGVTDIIKGGNTRIEEMDLDATYPLFDYAPTFMFAHFEAPLSAGLLCLCSLCDLVIETLQSDIGKAVSPLLAEPHRYSTSLLYLAILQNCEGLARAIITAKAKFSSFHDDDSLASARAHVCELPGDDLDVNAHFEGHPSSLLALSLQNCHGITELLLDHGPEVPPLEVVVRYGKQAVQLLLSRSSLAQDQSNALIIHAARELNEGVVEHFLQTSSGVSVRVQALEATLFATDAAHLPRQKGLHTADLRLRIVKLLLDADAGMSESCADFRTQALDAILRCTDWKLWYHNNHTMTLGAVCLLAMKRLLGIGGGIDFDGFDGDCETALVAAAAVGQADLVKHLLEHGADPHCRSTRYGRPVNVALLRGHTEVVSLLNAASTAWIGHSSTRMVSPSSVRTATKPWLL